MDGCNETGYCSHIDGFTADVTRELAKMYNFPKILFLKRLRTKHRRDLNRGCRNWVRGSSTYWLKNIIHIELLGVSIDRITREMITV